MKQKSSVDTGWAWMVLVGSFISYFIADGWSYSFGTIFPEIVDYFNESKGKTAIIPTLMYGIPMLISPIVCALINQYGFRLIGTLGGLFTGLSLLLASFAGSVESLCLSIGILTSIGLSMVYVASIISVTCYFEKRRGLATALAVTGSGLGAMIFPIMMNFLMELYAWRGMILIASACCFQLIPACALYRNIDITENGQNERKTKATQQSEQSHLELTSSHKAASIVPATTDPMYGSFNEKDRDSSNLAKDEKGLKNTSEQAKIINDKSTSNKVQRHDDGGSSALDERNIERSAETNQNSNIVTIESHVDIVPATSTSEPIVINNTRLSNEPTDSKFSRFVYEIRSIPSEMCSKVLLSNSHFLVFCAANFLIYLWISMPFVYIIDRALELKISLDLSVFLLSVVAIGRTVGQLVVGVAGDRDWCDANLLYSLGVVVCGVATTLMPTAGGYWGMWVCCAAFGASVSVTGVLPLICLIDFVGLPRSTSAFGLLQLVQGLGTLLGTPIAGWLYDATGDYEISFYIAGIWLIVSGLILLPHPLLKFFRHRRDENNSVSVLTL